MPAPNPYVDIAKSWLTAKREIESAESSKQHAERSLESAVARLKRVFESAVLETIPNGTTRHVAVPDDNRPRDPQFIKITRTVEGVVSFELLAVDRAE